MTWHCAGVRGDAATCCLALLMLTLAAGGATGCGDDAKTVSPTVSLNVTRDFGRIPLVLKGDASLDGHGTVLRLLRAYTEAKVARDESWVESVEGLAPTKEGLDETSWVLNVNGIESDTIERNYTLYPGDIVQYDYRDWYVTLDVRATVGAFPQTFTRGVFGRRFPVTVECERPSSSACRRVRATLRRSGVDPDGGDPPGPGPTRSLPQRARILVGAWDRWAGRTWPHRIDKGPRYSGVFARFSPAANELRLLDWNAHRVRSERAGTGLIAALRPTEEDLLWVITGTDARGVARASNALDAADLENAFAVAVTRDGVMKLPLPPR